MSMWNSVITDKTNFPNLILTEEAKEKVREAFNAPLTNETLEQMKPYMVNQQPCLWDSFSSEERNKPMMLSCSCPKCSFWC